MPPRVEESAGDAVHALQRRCMVRSPGHKLPGSKMANRKPFRTPLRPIYNLAVEPPSSEFARTSTRRQGSGDLLHAHPYAQHVSTRAWHTLARDWHTLAPGVAPRVRQVSPNLQSSCHVAGKKKKKEKFGEVLHAAGTRHLPLVSPRFRHISTPHRHATWQKKKK